LHPLPPRIAIEAIRFVASTQSLVGVVFHAGWMLLALATWGHASGGEGAIGTMTHTLIGAFVWLGGVDADGHGDAGSIMVVWGKLSLVVYLLELALRPWTGRLRPFRLSRIALFSGVVAAAGYTLALWHEPDTVAAISLTIAFSTLATIGTLWAVIVQRMLSQVADGIGEHAKADRLGARG